MTKNWENKKLGEMGTIFNGNSINARVKKSRYSNIKEELPYIATKDIDRDTHSIDYNNGIRIPFDEPGFKIAHKYATLICSEGGNAGRKIAYLENNVCFVNKLIATEVRETIYPKFLYYWYLSPAFSEQFFSQVFGIIGGISIKNFRNLTISFPPLSEQKRITKILNEAFEKIAKAKENTEKNLQNARELFESYLQVVFANKDKGWDKKALGDDNLIEIIDGDRGKNYPTQKDFLDEGHCLFMNTKNVRSNGFDFKTTMFISKKKDMAMGKGKLKRNDVVMTTRGTIGNLGVYSDNVEYDNIRINSGMLIFRPNLKELLPEYLFEILRSGVIKEQIKKHVSGAAQPQLPIRTLVNFTFPFPKSLSEQRSIVNKLGALSAKTRKLEVIYQQKLADLEELKKTILQEAFNGELVGAQS